MNLKKWSALVVGLIFLISCAAYARAAVIPDPETFFGHKPGADNKLLRWDKIHEYFQLLGKSSDRIKIENLGKTTMGHPFILAVGIGISFFELRNNPSQKTRNRYSPSRKTIIQAADRCQER